MADSRAKSEAELRFAKAQKRQHDAAKAMSEAEAESRRVDANTARLRALRLARDAKEAAAEAPPKKKPRAAAKAKPRPKQAPAGRKASGK